jgi:hypothetical protein
VLWAVTLIQSMTACMSDLHNKGRLNCVFELVGVSYGPRPMAGTDAFPEDSKKRKIDATGKTPVGKMPLKCVKAPGKKKAEPLKIVVSWTKSGSKTPFDVEVASTEPTKRVKKVVPNPAVAPTPVWATVGASGSRGATEGAKATSATQKHRVPASRMLAEASSTESLESSPHELLPRASPLEVVVNLHCILPLESTSAGPRSRMLLLLSPQVVGALVPIHWKAAKACLRMIKCYWTVWNM